VTVGFANFETEMTTTTVERKPWAAPTSIVLPLLRRYRSLIWRAEDRAQRGLGTRIEVDEIRALDHVFELLNVEFDDARLSRPKTPKAEKGPSGIITKPAHVVEPMPLSLSRDVLAELSGLWIRGATVKACAEHFGTTEAAITAALRDGCGFAVSMELEKR
jgi:hypothetical protein